MSREHAERCVAGRNRPRDGLRPGVDDRNRVRVDIRHPELIPDPGAREGVCADLHACHDLRAFGSSRFFSYLIRLTGEGERLLGEARPAFWDYAKAVEGRLDSERVGSLRAALEELRDAVTAELESRA